MTNDYKSILLKYLTNNLNRETGVNIPEFDTVQTEEATSIVNQINQEFPYGIRQNGVVQCKNSDGEYNGYTIVYGFYITEEGGWVDTAKGYMLIFDENFNLVQILKQYKSGTDFGVFMKIVAIDDGTLVALDHYDNRNRILLLNNPSMKLPTAQNYEVILRTSYNLQGAVQNISYSMKGNMYVLEKDPNSANYLIGALDNGDGYEGLTQLTINVGSTNNWNDYSYQTIQIVGASCFQNILYTYVNWREQIPVVYAYNLVRGYNETNETWYDRLYCTYSDDNRYIHNGFISNVFAREGIEDYTDAGFSFIGLENFYLTFAYGNIDWYTGDTDCFVEIYHINRNNTDMVYQDNFTQHSETGVYGSYTDIEMYNINGTIGCIYSTVTERVESYSYMKTMGVLITSNDDTASVLLGMPYYWSYNSFHINSIVNQFDLYKYFNVYNDVEEGAITKKSDIVYNYLYYNGEDYENTNSLKAKQGYLYDENGIIFARGLYNHVINENITEDTIQVPNTMINDTEITISQLIGQTNKVLIEDTEPIEKNVYETLYINFFNEILIENRNTATYIQNKPASIRLNNSVSNLLDYNNAKIGKIRKNYKDGTSSIEEVEAPTISNGVATYTFNITTTKLIDSIDLISNDENTTYQTINTQSLVQNKLYIITQDCYVE